MDTKITRIAAAMGAVGVLLAGIASAAGIFLRGDLATNTHVTVRGEAVQVVTEGVYRYNAEGIVAEGIGWDIVTLFVVVPATLVALALVWRGSLRATLAATGLLAYFCYQYLQYAVYWAYGPLYPVYVATLAFSVSALGLLLYSLDFDALRKRVGPRFPRRAITGYSVAVIVLLVGLWLPVIGGTLGGVVTDELQGASTLVVPAFDLGLLLPLAIFTAIAVYRRTAVGHVLGILLLVKGGSMALAIAAMLVVEYLVTDELLAGPLVVFAIVALMSVAIGVRALRSVDDSKAASSHDRDADGPREPAPVPAFDPTAG